MRDFDVAFQFRGPAGCVWWVRLADLAAKNIVTTGCQANAGGRGRRHGASGRGYGRDRRHARVETSKSVTLLVSVTALEINIAR
ncbi:MAG: hypothetical protein KGJ52_02445 [Gammaproteobacteria bacterium]|nr:hypothetical protein [Gammaproteobacteria bacterium]